MVSLHDHPFLRQVSWTHLPYLTHTLGKNSQAGCSWVQILNRLIPHTQMRARHGTKIIHLLEAVWVGGGTVKIPEFGDRAQYHKCLSSKRWMDGGGGTPLPGITLLQAKGGGARILPSPPPCTTLINARRSVAGWGRPHGSSGSLPARPGVAAGHLEGLCGNDPWPPCSSAAPW